MTINKRFLISIFSLSLAALTMSSTVRAESLLVMGDTGLGYGTEFYRMSANSPEFPPIFYEHTLFQPEFTNAVEAPRTPLQPPRKKGTFGGISLSETEE